jgi:hypothetical protein
MQTVRIEHRYSTKGYELKEKGKRDKLGYSTAGDRPHGVDTINVGVRKARKK